MSTIEGPNRHDYWRVSEINLFEGAPFRLNNFMPRNRFDEIGQCLGFTDINPPPVYTDKFFLIRQMVKEWNENMARVFSPGWVSCLDESMMEWTNMYSCPGFMYVPRKPHPLGNEWHTIACGISGILYCVELVEGKDAPPEIKPDFINLGKTPSLLLRLTRKLFGTGKVVILDSGFCVLQGLIELAKKGVYASSVIKKRRYWPKYVDGESIKKHFEDKPLGSYDELPGRLDNVPFHIFAMKDVDWVMMMMSTYGMLTEVRETSRYVEGRRCSFKYTEVFNNHYLYRHAVDDHNAKRHAPISVEKTWGSRTWSDRVFSFLFAITEVNCMLAAKYFCNRKVESMLLFRKELAKELIYNNDYRLRPVDCQETLGTCPRMTRNMDHHLLALPKFSRFEITKIVASESPYPQRKCNSCNKRTRNYCACSPGTYRCNECYAIHLATVSSMP